MGVISWARRIKLFLLRTRFHRWGGFFARPFRNLGYMADLSVWIENHKNEFEWAEFPVKFDYGKRMALYEYLCINHASSGPIDYLEFGVFEGDSIRFWSQHQQHADSRFHGFDTFEGLPEGWTVFKAGDMTTHGQIPQVDDQRIHFHKGLFQDTLPPMLSQLRPGVQKVIMLDADLYTSTLYALATLNPYLNAGDLILFDEFNVPLHEFRAFTDFTQSFYRKLRPVAAVNNFYQIGFKVVS